MVLRFTLRRIWRNRFYSFLNAGCLAFAISLFFLVSAIKKDQLSYDNFQAPETYRINTVVDAFGQKDQYASTMAAVAEKLKRYPEITQVTKLTRGLSGKIEHAGKDIEVSGFFTGSSFFDVFNFEVTSSQPKNQLLTEPNTLVISDELAEKLFDNPTSGIGQIIKIGSQPEAKICGIVKTKGIKTHLKFDCLGYANNSTVKQDAFTFSTSDKDYSGNYIYVRSNGSFSHLEQILNVIAKDFNTDPTTKIQLQGQRVSTITSGPEYSNSITASFPQEAFWMLTGLAIAIVLCSSFNYTNLTLSQMIVRNKEIAVKKTLGASGNSIIRQFLLESAVISFLAFSLALCLYRFLLVPMFKSFQFTTAYEINLSVDPALMMIMFAFALFVGLLSGILPALYLARVNVIKGLRGISSKANPLTRALNKSLTTIQLCIAIVFIITVVHFFRQMNFIFASDHGLDSKNIVNVPLQGQEFSKVAAAFSRNGSVQKVAGVSHIMGTNSDRVAFIKNGDEEVKIRDYTVTSGFNEMLHLPFAAGANFPENLPPDRELYAIVNESFLKRFQLPLEKAVGHTITLTDGTVLTVAGVLKNFHFKPLNYEIEPLLLRHKPSEVNFLQVKLTHIDAGSVKALGEIWKALSPQPFQYELYSERIDATYTQYVEIGKIITAVGLLAVIMSIISMFAMIIYTIQARVKETAIRKVYGASLTRIFLFLSRTMLPELSVALILGIGTEIFLNSFALGNFAYRVDLLTSILLSVLITIIIIFLTIGKKVYNAALTSPTKILNQ